MSKFVHLHTHSHYSLLDGLSKVEALVKKAKEFGMEALAITDHGNMHCAVEFYKKAKEAGIKPIIGVEVYMAKGSRLSKISNVDNMRYHLTLLVKNEVGYRNLCKLVTASHLEGFYYKPRIDREILEKYHDGLICLSGCFSGEIAKLLRNGRVEEAEDVAIYYKKIFHEDYYLEIQPHSPEINDKIIELSRKLGLPLVATQDSHYTLPEDKPIHEVLLAVQTNNRLDGEDRFTFHDFNVSFKSQEEMANDFKHLPEAIENTVKIAAKCNFEFKLGQTFLPKYEVPDGKDANSHLRELVQERLPKRFSSPTDEIKERLEYELGVIEKTGFADYFLIVQDFINWAKSHGIVVGPGRGSAAGSLVSYVLGITDVDPLKYNLLFERFLNPERISMPDIDIDFADRRRDEVLGYIKDKYGEDRVAQIITFGTMAARAAVRDAGRALGLSYSFCDEIARLIPFHVSTEKTANLPKDLESVPELKEKYEHDAGAKKLLDIAMKLEGVARHASVHACGVVISPQPLVEYMPLQRSPQDEKAVITQLEMHSVEDLGLLKIDLLGLRNLTIIEETIRLIRETRGIDIKISDIPLQDKETFELLQTAETTGVFQFECLSGDTLVSNTTLKKLYEKRDKNKLESVYVDEGKIHKNRILNVVKSGVKDVYALIAENGWYIKATKDHNFLTDNGWKRLIDLKPGDKVLLKNKARHLLYNLCETCGKQISGQKEGKSRFCYECSARFYSNPSKQISRTYMKAARTKFFENGGEVWNKGVNVQNNEVWRETAKKISVALTGISLEARYGREKSEQIKKRSSQRFSGSGNPMFGKPSPHRKGGVRNDLQHYVRSNWEADFARILNLYGVEYEYEPKMFVLRNSRGGIIHYTPDFYVKSTNTFYEIKGWMHDLDQEKINLFQEQYSQYNFVLINKTKFAELALRYKNLVRWECPRIPERSFKFLEVKEIKYAGKEETYDIAMEAPGNNFVANGFVVHNSSGMRRYMKDLKPTELEDLVALVALFRPGPMELIPSFISRKFGREKIEYLHPKLEPILKNTYGVGVYQEQMMRIARDLAGFTLSEADTLRKAIGKKIKSLLDAQKGKLINGMIKNGIDKKVAEKIWELFPPFARYGFNRSHAVCYALIGYQTAYLKTHYPVEFMTALLNNSANDVERISFLINEVRRMGTEVMPPDVNKSAAEFVPEGKNIRFGILAIKNIGTHITEVIVNERMRGGPYQSLADFITRIEDRDLNKKSLESLTKSGALDSLGVERMAALKNIDDILRIVSGVKKQNGANQANLFGNFARPEIRLQKTDPASKLERLSWEKELLGLYVTDHPLKDFLEKVESNGKRLPQIKEAYKMANEGKNIRIYGIISKIQRKSTRNGSPMIFAKIEDLTDNIEVLIFDDVLKKNPLIWEEGNILELAGRISRKNGEPKILCNDAKKLVL